MKALLTKSEKERLLGQFESSGKTYAQFAQENGLNVKTFSRWIYEWHHQKQTAGEIKFVEIKPMAQKVNEIKIHKSGMDVTIPSNLEFMQMKNILTVLAAL